MTELEQFSSISLAELTAQGELLRRYDTKYLIHLNQLPDVYAALSQKMLVLEHNGLRCAPYTTQYYDTSDLRSYHDHLKQRRKRFKIRTRHYQDPHDGFVEIKIKKPRGQTLKVRWPTDATHVGTVLGSDHVALINEALAAAWYPEITEPYLKTLNTNFQRTTLFDSASQERITIDTHLIASQDTHDANLGRHYAIIEIKSPAKTGTTHRLFTQLGIRPISISKYCVAMTALHPELGGAPWRRSIRLLQNTSEQQYQP
jgi:hypothetical protein